MSEAEPSVLWTILPPEVILGNDTLELPGRVELRKEGRILEVIPGPHGVGAISRLISTNPIDYLNPDWQPGALVSLFSISR